MLSKGVTDVGQDAECDADEHRVNAVVYLPVEESSQIVGQICNIIQIHYRRNDREDSDYQHENGDDTPQVCEEQCPAPRCVSICERFHNSEPIGRRQIDAALESADPQEVSQ